MLLLLSDERISRARLRHFGWSLALLLALVAWRQGTMVASLAWQIVAGSIFAVATVWPGSLEWPHRAMMTITYPLRWILSYFLLAVVYYGLVTPLALCLRMSGRDGVPRRLDPSATTYWRLRDKVTDLRRYGRQF